MIRRPCAVKYGLPKKILVPAGWEGIELRDQRQQSKTRSQLAFGEAWRRNRISTHKREMAMLLKMQKLRSNGNRPIGRLRKFLTIGTFQLKPEKGNGMLELFSRF
jgi:hypothetical protein